MLETTIILQGKDAKMWAMMKALETMGAFNIPYGSVTVNFSAGNITFVEIAQTFRTAEFPKT